MGSQEAKLLLLIFAFVMVLVVIRAMMFYRSFKKELDYLNSEIRRTNGAEQERWKRAKRRLLLSLIPFYHPRRRKRSHH